MDRQLINYLPPVLREIAEFRAINDAMQPEIEAAWTAAARVLANQFLTTADETGVKRWESELRIFPKDTDTLDARKARIKAVWNRELPYTFVWLKNWLSSLCGPDGHTESVNDYIIDVQLDYNALPQANDLSREILEMLLNIRPENMLIRLTAALQSTGRLAQGAFIEISNTVEVWPRIVNNLESHGTAGIKGVVELNRAFEIFPQEVTE